MRLSDLGRIQKVYGIGAKTVRRQPIEELFFPFKGHIAGGVMAKPSHIKKALATLLISPRLINQKRRRLWI